MMREVRSLVRRPWDSEGSCIEPLEEPLEDLGFLLREAHGLVEALCKSGVECCGEEWACACKELFVYNVADWWSRSILLVADDYGSHGSECAKRRT